MASPYTTLCVAFFLFFFRVISTHFIEQDVQKNAKVKLHIHVFIHSSFCAWNFVSPARLPNSVKITHNIQKFDHAYLNVTDEVPRPN
jgi:hypothetical protein